MIHHSVYFKHQKAQKYCKCNQKKSIRGFFGAELHVWSTMACHVRGGEWRAELLQEDEVVVVDD